MRWQPDPTFYPSPKMASLQVVFWLRFGAGLMAMPPSAPVERVPPRVI